MTASLIRFLVISTSSAWVKRSESALTISTGSVQTGLNRTQMFITNKAGQKTGPHRCLPNVYAVIDK